MQEFESAYKREFGFVLEKRAIIVDDVRVRSTGRVRAAGPAADSWPGVRCRSQICSGAPQGQPLPEAGKLTHDPGPLPEPATVSTAYFEVNPSRLHPWTCLSPRR